MIKHVFNTALTMIGVSLNHTNSRLCLQQATSFKMSNDTGFFFYDYLFQGIPVAKLGVRRGLYELQDIINETAHYNLKTFRLLQNILSCKPIYHVASEDALSAN